MDIDIIITWVDNNDPSWQREKAFYSSDSLDDTRARRFRSWDNLQYLFRSIEAFAPWYHKIFLVTCGHVPPWLKTDHDRLVLIKHEDYIPPEWLPTFSSRTIDMNFHRIGELSEHFVYFNDDMFLLKPVDQEDFFKKELPRDSAVMKVWPNLNLQFKEPYRISPLLDMVVINKHFDKREVIRKHPAKWLNPCYGKWNLINLLLLPWRQFTGFQDFHLPIPFLKSSIKEIWDAEEEWLSDSCSHRFREGTDLNNMLFLYWRKAKGEFVPQNPDIGRKLYLKKENMDRIIKTIKNQEVKMLCLNDTADDKDFEAVKEQLNLAFDDILPRKSSFEL